MTPEQVTSIVSNLGFPIAVAIAFAIAVWKFGNKLVDAHVKNLDRAGERFEAVAKSMEEISDSQSKICARLDQVASDVKNVCRAKS